MNHTQTLREAYAGLETLSVQNDDAGELLADVLAMLEDRHAQIVGAFEDEYGHPSKRIADEDPYKNFRGIAA